MEKYTAIIVDDEALARELLTAHIAKIPHLELVAECTTAIEAKFALQQHQPDLLFLDIQMPDLSGLELLRVLKKRPATILTTAYSEYALEGYELDVLDYLLKPIEFERFFKAVSKAVEWLYKGNIDGGIKVSKVLNAAGVVEPAPTYFFVKSDYKIVKVVFDEILFIEALQKYVRIHTAMERVVTLLSMSQLEAVLPKGQFHRIHRSYILNLEKIKSIEGNQVNVGQHQLPVSKGQRDSFLERVKERGLGF
ncbi:MAG TPA: LytTR family DNA-binding domain-containing protein [Saprospiraceae bacterium]|nr:LytTR family DNA-binding domain-containing protein [Saprospiraceae bacterium]HMQ81302.1 LytTR family DNA-binding domain-containing protein [Saprospiraceae bacterium]